MEEINQKVVKYVLPAEKIDMGGFPVNQALPTTKVDHIDPFLLLHHGKVKYSSRRLAKNQGVGPHPHRGFSPVTFVIEGAVHHRDSRRNNQVAKKGDVQWMHAGMGIIHSERPAQAFLEKSREQEIVQLWINSPSSSKMKIPSYQFISGDEMPIFYQDEKSLEFKIVAGNYEGHRSKTITESPLLILWGKGYSNAKGIVDIPYGYNSSIYLIRGSIRIEGFGLVESENLIYFDKEDGAIVLELKEEAEFLILAGAPINEKVVQSGPFVMNSETEILVAMRDYQMGKMGVLIEDDLN